MTLPQVFDLFHYWRANPPEHETLALFARVFTTWEPPSGLPPEEEHRRSLERRWQAGAMNAKQLFEAFGGALALNGAPGQKMTGREMPGIGPFPGA